MTPTCGHDGGHIVPPALREQFGLDELRAALARKGWRITREAE